mgnify:CR=1 FL=1
MTRTIDPVTAIPACAASQRRRRTRSARDAQGLSWAQGARHLWPQTLFGVIVCGALLWIAPTVLVWSLPLTAGYLLAVPFAVLTADPAFGRALKRLGLCGIPEDFTPPSEILASRRGDSLKGLTCA